MELIVNELINELKQRQEIVIFGSKQNKYKTYFFEIDEKGEYKFLSKSTYNLSTIILEQVDIDFKKDLLKNYSMVDELKLIDVKYESQDSYNIYFEMYIIGIKPKERFE